MTISPFTSLVAPSIGIPAIDPRIQAYLDARAAEKSSEGPAAQDVVQQQVDAPVPETDQPQPTV